MRVVLSGFSVRLFCFVLEKNVMYVWLYACHGCSSACVCRCDGDVICVGHDMNWCSWWWYVCSVYMLNGVGERTPPRETPVLN